MGRQDCEQRAIRILSQKSRQDQDGGRRVGEKGLDAGCIVKEEQHDFMTCGMRSGRERSQE